MARESKPFKVDTSPTKEVVVTGLTKDASVNACIFDLIDNSIDAARDSIFRDLPQKSRKELPDSYAGFKISLDFNSEGFRIEDNCGGIPVDALRTMVMRFGKPSSHEVGIGVFGVGLNRALFKIGKVTHLVTDTGKQRSELILKTDEYLLSPDWELPAEEFQSRGVAGTIIEIRQLPSEIAREFADKSWVDNLRRDIGNRYGRFIAKGLELKIDERPALDEQPSVREDGPFDRSTSLAKHRTASQFSSSTVKIRITDLLRNLITTKLRIKIFQAKQDGLFFVMIAQ